MKRIVAVVLIGLLVAPPALADQKPGKPISWEEVQQLKAGTEITLSVAGGPYRKVRLLWIDQSTLVTLNLIQPKLPVNVERALIAVGPQWPAVLNAGGNVTNGRVRVSPEGIFDGDRKVADLTVVVQQMPHGGLLAVPDRHSHFLRTLGWIGLGAAAVVILAASIYAGVNPLEK